MKYRFSYTLPHKQIVDIECRLEKVSGNELILQLPAWRPGRYELQNYGRYMTKLTAYNVKGEALPAEKISREQWKISPEGNSEIVIRYRFYCTRMDAGGSWLDEEQLYLNFINCCVYVPGRENEPCEVLLDIPDHYKIACGIQAQNKKLTAKDFYELVDSPCICAADLQHASYIVQGITFHIWLKSAVMLDSEKVIPLFEKFTEAQLKCLGDFPEKDYHFLLEVLPYKHYHGVEHRNSTVITLGPSGVFYEDILFNDFLGISSHELFHAWNICKIRPAEMFPYDFTKENYFQTGFVAEGFTTYYGDLFLARSGVFTLDQYFQELNTTLNRHFHNYGNKELSLAESSFDLWIDGYSAEIPDRKVSIYVKGCVSSLILDLEIRKHTEDTKSLDDVMRVLWNDYAKKRKGYFLQDIIAITEQVSGKPMKGFFEECIFGTTDLKNRLVHALDYVGVLLQENPSKNLYSSLYGFTLMPSASGKIIIDKVEPGSPADLFLVREDEILEINGVKTENKSLPAEPGREFSLKILRKGRILNITLPSSEKMHLTHYTLELNAAASEDQVLRREKWIKGNNK